jgi:hypothetical protein
LPAKTIANPIVEDILDNVFKVKRVHTTVNRNTTLENWQKSYLWLQISETGIEVRMKYLTCHKFKAGNVCAIEGAINIHKSAIHR